MEEEFKTRENSESINDSENEEKTSKHKKRKIIIPAILAVIAIITGLFYYVHSATYVSTDDAYIEGHDIPISSKVSGNIIKVHFDDNQKVQKGQLLVELDPADYEVKYEQALAKLQSAIEKKKSAAINVNLTSITSDAAKIQAQSGVEATNAGINIAEKQILQGNADLDSVKASYNLAESDFNRCQKLYKLGAASKQDFDRTSTNYKSAKAKLDATEAQLQAAYSNKEVALKSLNQALGKFKGADTVKEQVTISDSQSRIASAEIKQLQADVKQTKLSISYTRIYAPSAGIITNKNVEEGAYVQIGQPLFAIVPEKRWIVANFKETQLTNMKIGQPVNIKIDSYPNKTFKGRIDSIQSSTGSASSMFPPENAVGSFVKVVQRIPVKIVFTEKIDPQYIIVLGMSVIPEVKTK